MAVPKITVIAIVAIIAVPILLGFALNLSQTTETDYKTDGDSVNVTPLLQSSVGHTIARANSQELNTNFKFGDGGYSAYPRYNSYNLSTKTSTQMWYGTYTIAPGSNQYWRFNHWDNEVYIFFGPGSTGITFNELDTNGQNPIVTVNNINALHYYVSDGATGRYDYASNGSGHGSINPTDVRDYMFFSNAGSSNVTMHVTSISAAGSGSSYVDIAGGFYCEGDNGNFQNLWSAVMPDYTTRLVLTINLDSIMNSSYSFTFADYYVLEKTTTGSVVNWNVHYKSDPTTRIDLYYNPGISNNTYQIVFEASPYPEVTDLGYYVFERHTEFRYIGSWPTTIGEANYYQVYSFPDSNRMGIYDDPGLSTINFRDATNGRTPTMRFDTANFRGFEFPIISNATYSPGDFKTNPSTTIKDVVQYGKSLTFAGNTYTVTNGNITLGSHQVSVDKLVFKSIPNADLGGYDNMIGNTLISNSANPSTITFNGNWSASISTTAQISYTYNKTEWHAGEFGWDGIDQNFLIVGLITCLGVFIALGIYARKKGTGGIIPLMIVVGCAAMVFFIML